MLVLSRKKGEQIDLVDEQGVVQASITIRHISGKRTSIGIQAIPQLRIIRSKQQPTTKQAG
ncbi:MAG: carbon storage regulator [Pirellulales bacterium]